MKSSRFYPSLILLIILNGLIKPVWILAIDRQVQNETGTTVYGSYFSIFSLSIVLSFISDLGFTAYYNRRLAAREENSQQEAGHFLLIKLMLALVYTVTVLLVAWFTGITQWQLLFFVILIQVFTSLFIFFRSIVTAQQWFSVDAWLSISDKTLLIICCGVLLYWPSVAGGISIGRFAFLQAACLFLAMAFTFVFLLRKGIQFSFSKVRFPDRQVLQQVFPFALIVLLMSAHARFDSFLLDRLHPDGAYQTGLYAGAYRLLDAANMGGYLVATFLLPYFARRWQEKKPIEEIMLTMRHYLIMGSLSVAAIAFFLAPWIQQTLYHETDPHAIRILQYCLPALIGYSITQVYGTVLTATGHIRDFCRITAFSLILNLFLNILLIPRYGALGCCFAALISQGLNGIFLAVFCRQRLQLRIAPVSLLIYALSLLVVSGFLYFTRDQYVSKWILISGAFLITFVIMWCTGLSRLKQTIFSHRNQP